MKKLSIIVAMGITSLGLAQNSYPEFQESKFSDLGSLGSNYEYLNEVQDGLTPNQVKYLEKMVSYWDVAQLENLEGRRSKEFDVTFTSNMGHIVASYDEQGKVVRAYELFRNIALPQPVSIAIAKEYPNWSIVKNKYSVLYSQGGEPKKRFKVQIMKDDQKKWLKVDPAGRIS